MNVELKSQKSKIDTACLVLVSILLGIWAIKGTIAFRNFLLVVVFLISAFIISREKNSCRSLKTYLPIISLCMMIIWVAAYPIIFHDFELTNIKINSNWLRCMAAILVGLVTANLAIKNKYGFSILFAGMSLSFVTVFLQYILRVFSVNNIIAVDYYGPSYIYLAKINAALSGVMLFSVALGSLCTKTIGSNLLWPIKYRNYFLGYYVSLIFIIIYSFVFIFDSKIGVGLSLLISFIAFLLLFYEKHRNSNYKPVNFSLKLSLAVLISCLILALVQSTFNKTWETLPEDLRVAIFESGDNAWMNPSAIENYPKTSDGVVVSPNNYERFKWAKEGVKLLMEHPLGVGSLNGPFHELLLLNNPEISFYKNIPPSTHSSWIEFGLGYGLLGLIFMIFPAIFLTYSFIVDRSSIRFIGLLNIISLFMIYTVGELSNGHALEIYFFWISYLTGILQNSDKHNS